MAIGGAIARYSARRLVRRLARKVGVSAPYVGALVALSMLGYSIRKKGVLGGTVHAGLDAIPYVGALKNAIELVRGDFIKDRAAARPAPETARAEPSLSDRRP